MTRVLALLILTAAACGERTVADHEPPDPPPDVGDEDPEPVAISDGSVECREGLAACDGACVDLQTDDLNCGVCGHGCREPEVFGHCEAGACPSALICNARNTSLTTCEDVCAEHGQRCDDASMGYGRGCAGERYMFWSTESYTAAFEDCEARIHPYETFGECWREIGWQIFVDDDPFSEAVACCCTQDP